MGKRRRKTYDTSTGTVYRNDGPIAKRVTPELTGVERRAQKPKQQQHQTTTQKGKPYHGKSKFSMKVVQPEEFFKIADTIFDGKYYCVGDNK